MGSQPVETGRAAHGESRVRFGWGRAEGSAFDARRRGIAGASRSRCSLRRVGVSRWRKPVARQSTDLRVITMWRRQGLRSLAFSFVAGFASVADAGQVEGGNSARLRDQDRRSFHCLQGSSYRFGENTFRIQKLTHAWLVRRGLLDVVDDENLNGSVRGFQLEAELVAKGFVKSRSLCIKRRACGTCRFAAIR